MTSAAWHATTGWLLAGLLLGCQDRDEKLETCDRKQCSARCSELSRGGDCDVRDSDCQQRIFEAVSCVRGVEGQAPEIRLLTEDEERAERQGVEAGALGDAVTLPDAGLNDAGAPARLSGPQRWDVALRLLGLKASESVFDDVDNLGGYYSGRDQRITLIDRGAPQDSTSAQSTLAHEFVHALQDQQVGLFELRQNTGRTTDATIALGCLIEGDAVLYEELAWGLLRGLSLDLDYFRSAFASSLKYARDQAAAAQSPYENLWLLRYGLGAQYLAKVWQEGGNQAVRAVFEAPPVSTVHWMRAVDGEPASTQPSVRSLSCDWATPPEGFEFDQSDSLGAFTLFAFLSHNLRRAGVHPNELSWERAMTWQQDRFEIFAGPSDETALSWRIRLADKETAQAVDEELTRSLPRVLILRRGAELEILAADTEALPAQWQGTDPDACIWPSN